MSLMTLSGEQLRKEAKRADRALGVEVVRVRAHDPAFKAALERTLAVEDEQLRRKARPTSPPTPEGNERS